MHILAHRKEEVMLQILHRHGTLAKLFILLFCFEISGCISNNNKQTSESASLDTIIENPITSDTTVLQDPTMTEPTESNIFNVQAYDSLYFGMDKDEVKKRAVKAEKIGNYFYNFSYMYNGEGQLYGIVIQSNPEQTLYYEDKLQPKYTNLCRVIAEKYGKKNSCGGIPSIFDVMNAKRYKMVSWHEGEKSIVIYLRQQSLDAFTVQCSIIHNEMELEEKARQYKIRNKELIESAEKF